MIDIWTLKGENIIAINDKCPSGDIDLVCTVVRDDNGNPCQPNTVTIGMDNHQMYQIALKLLSYVDARDTRGTS